MNSRITEKFDYIDALRAVAILLVIIHHTAQKGHFSIPHGVAVALSLGTRGVQLFFIASALTLCLSYKKRMGNEKHLNRNFFIRRFFRIAPLYYLAILYYILVAFFQLPHWTGTHPVITSNIVISNVFFISDLSPFWINSLVPGGWSIAAEMVFYLLFPFLFVKIKNCNDSFSFFAVALVIKVLFQEIILFLNILPQGNLGREYLFYYLPAQMPIFALGFVLFFLVENSSNWRTVSGRNWILVSLLIPIQVGLSFDFLYLNHIIFGFFFIALALFMKNKSYNSLLGNFLRYIGRISFSLYIIHFVVLSWMDYFGILDFCDQYLLNFSIRLILVVSLSVVVSTITYHFIENLFQKVSVKLINKINNFNTK